MMGEESPLHSPIQWLATSADSPSGNRGSGARHPRIGEPLVKVEIYPIQWREPRLDLAELARLRWVEGYSRKQLAEKYGKTTGAIQNYFQELKRLEFRVSGLSEKEREKILWVLKN